MEVDTHPHTPSIASLMASPPNVPQKRKEPPPQAAPTRPVDPAPHDPKSVPDPRPHSSSPTDEYGSGRIVCENCGDSVPIRDEATGNFTVRHWEAHRGACQSAPQPPAEPASEVPTSSHPDPSQPQAKRRRAKRTEEERIDYLRSDPYVAKFEAYRVLCASCDKWIRLRPNSTYCSIPWDAHRKSCLAKRVAKNAHPVVIDDRSAAFAADPNVKRFDSSRVQCRACDKWIPLLTDDNAAAIQAWKQHRESCQRQVTSSPGASTSKFNIANVPPPSKHLLALASSSSLPPTPAPAPALPAAAAAAPPSSSSSSAPPPPARTTAASHSISISVHSGPPSSSSSTAAAPFVTSFKDYTPHNFSGVQESRRRNADQRAAALRADPYLGEVEPNRVFCRLCRKWVQLRQDSTFCAYPWQQHRTKCLKKHQKISDREAEMAELRATRDAALAGELEISDSSVTADPEEEDDDDDEEDGDGEEGDEREEAALEEAEEDELDELDPTDRARRRAERRRAKALAKGEAAAARLRQLEEAHQQQQQQQQQRPGRARSVMSSEEDGSGVAAWEERMEVDVLPDGGLRSPRLADLDSASGRLGFLSRSVRHLFKISYARTDELTIAALVTYLNAALPPDKHEDFDTAEVTKMVTGLRERGAFVFEGDVIRLPG